MKSPRVSVAVINWNGKHYLEECFETLLSQTYQNKEIILVDNGSTDGSAAFVKKNFPDVRVIAFKENYGFCGAYNRTIDILIKEKKSDFMILLNNDVKVEKHMLENLVICGKKHSDAVILGPKIFFYDRPSVIWSAGVRFNPLFSRATLIGLRQEDSPRFNEEKEVDQIVGAALMIKLSAIGKIRLKENYWAYYEETDFQYRLLKKTGGKAYYCPKAVMWHKVAGSTGGGSSPYSVYYLVRNRAYFIEENIHGLLKITSYFSWSVEIISRILLYSIRGKIKQVYATIRGSADYITRKKGKISL